MANLRTTSPRIPELCAGDVLTRDEFHRRYSAMPHGKKAELIEGVVYMGSPVRFDRHSRPEGAFAAWIERRIEAATRTAEHAAFVQPLRAAGEA